MSDKPAWREWYDRLSDELGPRFTELTASDGFAELVEVAGAVSTRASDELARSSRRFLHAWNLPAGSDIAVLRQELGALTREVRSLSRQVEALQRELDESRTTTGRRRRAPAASSDPDGTGRAATRAS